MTSAVPPSPRTSIAWGVALAALGAGLAWLIGTHPEQLRAPAWVAYAAAGAFVLAGSVLVATGLRLARLADWLAVLLTVALVLPGMWIAFGSGPRQCTASLPLPAAWSDAICRGAFGVGAVIGLGVVALLVRHALRPPQRRS